jgi:hypothetical protein
MPVSKKVEVRYEDGVYVPTMASEGDAAINQAIRKERAEGLFLELLEKMNRDRRYVSDSIYAQTYAPKVFAKRPDSCGYRISDFASAMERLFFKKRIKVAETGSPSRLRRQIEACNKPQKGNENSNGEAP